MKRAVLLIVLLSLIVVPSVFASPGPSTADSEIQKLTHYAKEYEVGNIDYAKLTIYISSVREGLNEILGVTNRELGGVVKQEKIREILGEPNEETRWVWVEGEEHDQKLKESIPIWRKIVFDGKKIQIGIEAFPSIYKRRKFRDNFEDEEFESEIEEGSIIYRLHFNVEFKRPEEQLDIGGKINEIKSLAETFSAEPTNTNAEALAEESVNAERSFQNYFMQGQGKCDDLMKSIFGSENQRQSQKILLNEISFFDGEDFEAIMRLEMCDECEYNWINLNMWLEGRGRFDHPIEDFSIEDSRQEFRKMSDEEFKTEIKQTIERIKQSLEAGEYSEALRISNRLNMINNAWSENSNNIWEEVREKFESKIFSMTEDERHEFDQNYGWIKQDQEQRKEVRVLQENKYQERKKFYLDLFSGYDKKEFYFTQSDFEMRLVEEFKERGEEVCNNNIDDNDNQQVDCQDSQCGGKVCGQGTSIVEYGNETKEVEVDFYCIQSICQAKEEEEVVGPVCGNHVCELGEANTPTEDGTCQSDCTFSQCPVYEAVECQGKVIFEGEDENGCQLPPICIEETKTCSTTGDCLQPSCGVAECIRMEPEDNKGTCKVTKLKECISECESWEQEIAICNNQKIIIKTCEDGKWEDTGAECEGEGAVPDFSVPTPIEEPISGNECTLATDCGGEDDVCSNGKCIQIPKVIREELEDLEPEKPEQNEESIEVNGIFGFFQSLLGNLRITGQTVHGEGAGEDSVPQGEEPPADTPEEPPREEPDQTEPPQEDETCPSPGEPPEKAEGCYYEETFDDKGCVSGYDYFCDDDIERHEGEDDRIRDDFQDDFRGDSDEREERDRGERERFEEENRERCEVDCARPCVEKCIRLTCKEETDCDVDKESKVCEASCTADDSCVEKCSSGQENWWEEFQDEDIHKEEKGVFQVGGGCRKEMGRTDGFIWFGGWGDPFERIDGLKNQFYSGGEADWCKQDLDNLIKQRKEFEKGFNQEFAQWFFEKYLPSSAEEWEQAQSGIYEIYWNSVDTQRQFAERMRCLKEDNIENVMDINLINIEYESEFGKLEYWEEIKEVQMERTDKKVTIVSPYMKVWIFPSEEFIKYEMKTSMAKGEFPGPPEEKASRENEGGLTEEEKRVIREDEDIMELIKEIADEYNGNADIAFQIIDREAEEIVFNLYIQINEENIMEIKPMLPEEVPAQDVKVEMDFDKLYEIIDFQEREMRGAETESPPWDLKPRHGVVKGFTDGIKMYLKMRSLIGSIEVTPNNMEGEIKDLMKSMMRTMGEKDERQRDERETEERERGEDKEGEEVEEDFRGKTSATGAVAKPVFNS